jgi:hypothetical protein
MRNDPLRRCATTLCEVNYAIEWQANEHFGLETEMIGIIRFSAWWKCQSGPCLLSGPGDMLFWPTSTIAADMAQPSRRRKNHT